MTNRAVPKMQGQDSAPSVPPLPSKRATEAPPSVSLNDLEQSDAASLTAFERAELSLLLQRFDLLDKQIDRWIAISRQRDQEMELTLGKVRAFAELAERIVQVSDSQLEKLVAVTTALIQLMERVQNPPQNQGA